MVIKDYVTQSNGAIYQCVFELRYFCYDQLWFTHNTLHNASQCR